ncbi:MAG: hypothetical protein LBU79_01120 [Planctomycetota bacterium]|jgi:hypothetical protein|nr:hypothetical protein [Planctomycetota bacterium]
MVLVKTFTPIDFTSHPQCGMKRDMAIELVREKVIAQIGKTMAPNILAARVLPGGGGVGSPGYSDADASPGLGTSRSKSRSTIGGGYH